MIERSKIVPCNDIAKKMHICFLAFGIVDERIHKIITRRHLFRSPEMGAFGAKLSIGLI